VKYKNFPFKEIETAVKDRIREGYIVHQKFTCDGCGSRQTISKSNVLYKLGKCEECGHVTDIEKRGCNYLLITGGPR
jgi:hypothetical protein